MRFALIAIDRPDAQEIRLNNRDAHLAYVAESGAVETAGPFLDQDGQMSGSLLILNVDSRKEAENWVKNDPYAIAGLFATVNLREWKKVIG